MVNAQLNNKKDETATANSPQLSPAPVSTPEPSASVNTPKAKPSPVKGSPLKPLGRPALPPKPAAATAPQTPPPSEAASQPSTLVAPSTPSGEVKNTAAQSPNPMGTPPPPPPPPGKKSPAPKNGSTPDSKKKTLDVGSSPTEVGNNAPSKPKPAANTSNQPGMSLDVLKNVKLKPSANSSLVKPAASLNDGQQTQSPTTPSAPNVPQDAGSRESASAGPLPAPTVNAKPNAPTSDGKQATSASTPAPTQPTPTPSVPAPFAAVPKQPLFSSQLPSVNPSPSAPPVAPSANPPLGPLNVDNGQRPPVAPSSKKGSAKFIYGGGTVAGLGILASIFHRYELDKPLTTKIKRAFKDQNNTAPSTAA